MLISCRTMVSIDKLFSSIKSNTDAESEARFCSILLKNVRGPLDVKALFPVSISHAKEKSSKQGSTIRVNFKTPLQAEEAATTEIDGITIALPKRGPKGLQAPVKSHSWKIMRDVKILLRRQMKALKEEAKTASPADSPVFERELALMQSLVRFLHNNRPGKVIDANQDFFKLYDEAEEVAFIKKFRVKVHTQIQAKISALEKFTKQAKNDSSLKVATKKRQTEYHSCQLLLQLLRGQRATRVIKPIKPTLKPNEIKEEEGSVDGDSSEQESDADEEEQSEEEEEEEAPQPPKRLAAKKSKRYFDK